MRIVPRFADVLARRSGRRSSRSTCRSACRSGPGSAAVRRRTRCGRCSARGNRRCSRCRRARRSMRPTTREACRSRWRHPIRRARCRSSSSTSRRKSARSTRACAPTRTLAARVFEVHPELAFWRLNGERALAEPKKVKSRRYEPGLALRRGLLIAAGLRRRGGQRPAAQRRRRPTICSMRWPAPRSRGGFDAGLREPFPEPPPRDAFGLPMAIWA